MFEDKTYATIMGDMLGIIKALNPEIDTRDGSLIYTALAPIALELETTYRTMEMIMEETFLETASREYLIKHGNQVGVEIHPATYGHYEGEFNVDLAIGTRFSLDEYNYTVIEKLSDPTDENEHYVFELVCETAGSEPNSYLGDLTPISSVPNLSFARLTSVLIYGEDEEDTEAYRYRIQMHVKEPPIDGNVYQYNEWLNNHDGIGKYKVKPCWNGINTVKLLVLNSEDKAASDELVREVQNYFDPPTSNIDDRPDLASYPQGRGMGNGQAPIGAIVTVDTVTEVPVTIECEVQLKDGYSSTEDIKKAVVSHFNSIALDRNAIAYMPISAAIYNTEGVADVKNLTVKVGNTVMSTASNVFSVSIADDEIPVLNENSVWSVV